MFEEAVAGLADRDPAGAAQVGLLAQCRWVLGQIELSADDPVAALRWLKPIARSGWYHQRARLTRDAETAQVS